MTEQKKSLLEYRGLWQNYMRTLTIADIMESIEAGARNPMERLDEDEEYMFQRALLQERVLSDEAECAAKSRPSIFLQFRAGDLRDPKTLASLIDRVKR